MSTRFILVLGLLAAFNSVVRAEDSETNQRPNILFCIADDASYPHMGAYGCSWVKTPAFDRVAREGILFTNAYTPNAKCAPSRACILTGRNSWQLKEAANHWCYFPAEFKTYCEVLAEQGYLVGKTAKGWAPGIANDAAGKPRQMTGDSFDKRRAQPPTTAINNTDYAANFQDFLDAAGKDQPWCFWYGSTEPHRGYEFGSGVAKGGKKLSDIDRVPDFWPDTAEVRNDMLDYAFEIEHFDDHLQRMLKLLDERGMADNTIVVVTADNGMPFPRVKGQEYELSNHLPLAIRWPQGIQTAGRTVEDYVSFVDFAPTFLEVAGLPWNESGMQPTVGRSLMNIFQSDQAGVVDPARDHVLIGKERHDVGRPNDWGYPIRGIVKQGTLYLENFETDRWPAGNPETGYLNCDGGPTKTLILNLHRGDADSKFWQLCFGKRPTEELYQVATDQSCLQNKANDPAFSGLKQELRKQLRAELTAQGDPRMEGQGYLFDNYPYADKNGKDFYKRYTAGEKVNAGWVNPSDFEAVPEK
jgi:arylsulfatase A-like enzyme